MAATGYEKDIDLPGSRPRTRARLLDVAREIPRGALTVDNVNRMTGGVIWLPWGDDGLRLDAVGCAVDYDKTVRDVPAKMYQPAFLIYDALTCGKLSGMLDQLWGRLEHNFQVQLSWAFAVQLETAEQGGLGLIGANNYGGDTAADYPPEIVTTAAGSVQLAIALLEDYLAEKLRGGLGVIHLTPGLYSVAVAFGLVDPVTYQTPTGHYVVGDAGHTGQATPTGGSAPGAGNAWVYATSDIWYAVKAQPKLEDAETGEGYELLRKNIDRPLLETYGLLAFDPNILGAALVSYSDSAG